MFWKRRSRNILERTIQKSYFKGAKQSFLKVRGCRKKFVEVQEEVAFLNLVLILLRLLLPAPPSFLQPPP